MIASRHAVAPSRPLARDFHRSPLVVFYELTRACDLACLHCRACAQPVADPRELSPALSLRLIDQLASFPEPPLVVFTGGDPLKRADLCNLVAHTRHRGLEPALTPSATPLVTREALVALQQAGLARLALSLDGTTAASHDRMRGVPGSFARTLEIMSWAQALGLPLQINTTLTPANAGHIDEFAELLSGYGIVLWSVFFLVPVGRGVTLPRLSAEQAEAAFEQLWQHAARGVFPIKTTEAPHYRRYAAQHRNTGGAAGRAPVATSLATNDGRGVMFVSHVGEIQPSGFLPLVCGCFPHENVVETYQHSPVFQALRDSNRLEGKCGRCEFRKLCGGSRARAFAVTGNLLAEEPDCVYQPPLKNSPSGDPLPSFASE